MLNMLFDRLDITKLKFVSLGGLRFLPSLAKAIRERNPQTNLLLGEFVPCIDGKYRYFRPFRVEIYRELGKIIRQRGKDIRALLCMETSEVWNELADVL
jgi:spore photoproduct lyase